MEITDEIKDKVFAQYLGQNILGGRIILKPLSAITNEDAAEVVFMQWEKKRGSLVDPDWAKRMVSTLALRADIYQFLQSKGYDLPHFLLGGRCLRETGLAIYEVKEETNG